MYSNADILLFDDVLSALDIHTVHWIVAKCFGGDLIHGRTVILVVRFAFLQLWLFIHFHFKTHHVAVAAPVSHWVVSLSLDGRVASQGPITEAQKPDFTMHTEVKRDPEEAKADAAAGDQHVKLKLSGKLMTKEEIALGHVGWPARESFLTYPYSANLMFFSEASSIKSWRFRVLDFRCFHDIAR